VRSAPAAALLAGCAWAAREVKTVTDVVQRLLPCDEDVEARHAVLYQPVEQHVAVPARRHAAVLDENLKRALRDRCLAVHGLLDPRPVSGSQACTTRLSPWRWLCSRSRCAYEGVVSCGAVNRCGGPCFPPCCI